ncbi:MAG TPA: CBS domain-containing protein [Thermoanaerobaculia bacterium]|nr:CBS domain-containing protein [Thermoanaerobaculia bacterium]
MDLLLRLSGRPPVVTTPDSSVLEAVEMMSGRRVGGVGVVTGDKLVGIFTERDLMERIVLASRDPGTTPIETVMTTPVTSVKAGDDPQDALHMMLRRHIRHLPVVDEAGRMLGMLSIRDLLQNQLEKAISEADALEAFLTADGPGG